MGLTAHCEWCSTVTVVKIRYNNRDRLVLPQGWKYAPTSVPKDRTDDAVECYLVCSDACLLNLTDDKGNVRLRRQPQAPAPKPPHKKG